MSATFTTLRQRVHPSFIRIGKSTPGATSEYRTAVLKMLHCIKRSNFFTIDLKNVTNCPANTF